MKSAFQFFFHMIIGSTLLFSTIYALGGRLIEEYNDIFSGAMFFIMAVAISGMVRYVVSYPPRQKASRIRVNR
jgi:hypothetical protein